MYRRSDDSESSVRSHTEIDRNAGGPPAAQRSAASHGAAGAAGDAYNDQRQTRQLNRTEARSASSGRGTSEARRNAPSAGRSPSNGGLSVKRGVVVLIVCVLFGLIMLGAGVYAASSISSNPTQKTEASDTGSYAVGSVSAETDDADASPKIGGGVIRTETAGADEKATGKSTDAAGADGAAVTPAPSGEDKQPDSAKQPDPQYTVTFTFWDRDPIYAKTDGGTARSILAENGYTLDGLHITSINADEWIAYDTTVNVMTLSYETVSVTEEIPYDTEYVYSDSVPSGQTQVTTDGSVGYKNVTYTIEYINGEENYRSLDSEYVTAYPVNQVISVGTAPSTVVEDSTGGYIYGADGTAYHYSKVITVKATYYNLPGNTASGLPVGDGIIATDPSVIPTGTSVYLKNNAMDLGVCLAADTGVYGAWVDVWMNENSPLYSIFAPTGVWEMTCYILD